MASLFACRNAPTRRGPSWIWSDSHRGARVWFVGRGPDAGPPEALRALGGSPALHAGWLEQTHSAEVLPAQAGLCGRGDGLWTAETDLALTVKTADCVPVVLAGGGHVAAVHAGWRGIAQEIVPRAVAALPVAASSLVAWIGPAIGACCYEVGEEVAEQVALASDPAVVVPGPTGRPHLDLAAAVAAQLHGQGVPEIRQIAVCTRCNGEWLHSFRRDRARAGRNYAFVWLGS